MTQIEIFVIVTRCRTCGAYYRLFYTSVVYDDCWL